MEFSVARSDLVRELSLSQGVVEKKATIPILSNVLLEAADDRLVLTATDLELGIRCSCPAKVKRPGVGTVPVKKVLDYVRLLPEAEINFKFAENNWANLVCGRSRTRIAGMSRESFPELPQVPEVQAEIPLSALAAMVSRTIFAISLEESRFTLNGALMVLRPEGGVMVATDGHRLAMTEQNMELDVSPQKALLPKKAMVELQKLAQDAGSDAKVSFSASENHLFFSLGERLLISRKLTGNFPDYERVLPKEHSQRVALSRDELRGALERVSQFSDERSHAVRLKFSPGEVVVHSSLSETGESEETLPANYDGPVVEVGFNAHYLVEFLRVSSEEQVTFCFRDSSSAGELQPEAGSEGYRYRYVVMPMRI